jgi:hypothetical protein
LSSPQTASLTFPLALLPPSPFSLPLSLCGGLLHALLLSPFRRKRVYELLWLVGLFGLTESHIGTHTTHVHIQKGVDTLFLSLSVHTRQREDITHTHTARTRDSHDTNDVHEQTTFGWLGGWAMPHIFSYKYP